MHSSQHFVTVGLRFVDAFNRGDIDACVDLLHPNVEWYASNRYSDAESHIGPGDVRLYLQSLHDHLDEPHMEPEDGFQIGDHVMLINRLRGKGTLAGSDVIERYNWVALIDGEKFRRVVTYATPAEARRALEEAAGADQLQMVLFGQEHVERYRARARAGTAEGGERERFWKLMTATWPRYAGYQKKTDREIPVVVLTPS